MLARNRGCSDLGWANMRHSVLPASSLHSLAKLQSCELGINDVRLRVEGGTGQALCRAVKQPTATKTTDAAQLVGPELADEILPLPTRWSLRARDVKWQTGWSALCEASRAGVQP